MFKENPKDWRELLGWITNDSAMMQHIVQELGVRDITIRRWVDGTSAPRPQNLRRLLSALPEYRERFVELLSDVESFSEFLFDNSHQEISSKFYTQIFQMRSTISCTQRYWSVANTIISQALSQLDPENLGMAISLVRCMISSQHSEKILSLRQSVGQGTPPLPGNLEQKAMFLGAESLAGYVISTCRAAEVQNYKEDNLALVGHQFEYEQSAAAYPILYAGKIAGCLLVSSAEPFYFLPTERLNLIADYAHLIALAFDAEDFVNPLNLELRMMPLHSEQRAYFSDFRQRLTRAKLHLYEERKTIDAEQYVWEELERKLLS